ncbi:MAG: hypothetical protein JW959_07765 [Pirellulales bacterium]|nr:hypothetical protein [Pirellulales bacterium]
MKRLFIAAAAALPMLFVLNSFAKEAEKTYTLRYRYKPGETVRWLVEHRSKVRATVSGSTQSTETLSISMKAWRVSKVNPDGTATFEHRVEWVDMRQKLTGRSEVRYDSRRDEKPPPGFETAAKSVGVPLSVVTMDPCGKIVERRDAKPRPPAAPETENQTPKHESCISIPLPEEPVPIGHTWTVPQNIDIPVPSGAVKRIKAVQRFTLEEVKTSVATIRVSTDVLTPIDDPAIESQLVQRESAGRVWFDIDAGRVLRQLMETDKHVVGFRGDASSIHYVNRFSERLAAGPARTAGKDANRD